MKTKKSASPAPLRKARIADSSGEIARMYSVGGRYLIDQDELAAAAMLDSNFGITFACLKVNEYRGVYCRDGFLYFDLMGNPVAKIGKTQAQVMAGLHG